MTRPWRGIVFGAACLMGLSLCMGVGLAQEKAEQPAGGAAQIQPGVVQARPAGGVGYAVPGFWSLQMKQVQDELELVDEQMEKLKKVAEEYQAAMRDDWTPLRDATPENRMELYNQIREKQAARLEEARKQVEKILLPHQLERLTMAELRMRGAWALQSPQIHEQLGLTDEQKKKLQENREQLMQKMQELQRESFDEALGVLTPEQVQKLKDLHSQGYQNIWGGRQQ